MSGGADETAAPPLPREWQVVALAAGAVALLLGLGTSLGWLLDIPRLVQIHPSFAPMVPNTAVCFLLAGLGLGALGLGSRLASRVCGAAIAGLAGLTVIAYLTNNVLTLDQLLSPSGSLGGLARPLQMAPNTAISFLLVGLALALAGGGKMSGAFVGRGAGVVVLSLSTVALVGYLFGIAPAFGWGRMVAMSPQTAVGLLIVGVAILAVVGRPDLAAGQHRSRWLALAVGAVGATTSLLLWQALAADQAQALQARLDAETLSVRNAVSLGLRLHVDALARLAHRWESRVGPLRAEWQDDAASYVQDFKGYEAVAWADPGAVVRWVTPLAGNEAVVNSDLLREPRRRAAVEAARRTGQVALTRPVNLLRGPRGFLAVVPLSPEGSLQGFIVAGFRGGGLLDSVLSPESRSAHRISLLLAGEPLGVSIPPAPLSTNFASRSDWTLLGQPWSVEVVPTLSWTSHSRLALPLGALCGGLLFSGVLAWSVLKTSEARLTLLAQQQSEKVLREAHATREYAHRLAEENARAVALAHEQFTREVAERRAAEQERDQFFSLSIDMVCISSGDGYFKRLNPAFEQTLGYTVAEMTGRPFLDFVHPDDVARTLAEVDSQLVEGRPAIRFENRYHHKDGSYRWLAWTSMPDVKTGMMYALARDVTNDKLVADRLQASEARYRDLVEAATDIIYRTNTAGEFTFVNAVAVRIMGYSEQELLGKHFTELVRADERDEVRQWYVAQWSARTPVTRREFRAVAKDGHEIWIEQTVQPILQGGRVVAFQAIARDVSVRKGLEAERERLILELTSTITQVRTLSSLLPMCSNCRRIKDDEDGSWSQLEGYLSKKKTGTQVSHGICPECMLELYPDYARRIEAKRESKG